MGVPKTILGLGDLLGGHRNQRKAEKKLMIMICYSEKIQIKIIKEKVCVELSPRETRYKFLVILS